MQLYYYYEQLFSPHWPLNKRIDDIQVNSFRFVWHSTMVTE